MGGKSTSGPTYTLRQPLQQLRRASLRDPGTAVEDDVVPHAELVGARCLQRERDGGVALHVADLAMPGEVARDDLVPLDADPDNRHLRAAVGVHRHEVRERAGLDQRAHALGQRGHRP